MTDTNNPSFAAIITITLPESNEITTLQVKLMPADLVPIEGDVAKPLQDCTLAELQQFAESLELELWDEHGSATLVDLVIDGQAEIEFTFADDPPDGSFNEDLWLEHAILLPDGRQPELETGELPAGEEEKPGQPALDELSSETPVEDEENETDDQLSEIEPGEEDLDDKAPAPIEASVDDSPAKDEPVATETPVDESGLTSEQTIAEELETSPETTEVSEAAAEPLVVAPGIRVLGLRRPLYHSTWTAVDILANESAFRDAQAHSLSSLDREVAGVLVGPQPEKQPDGRYLVHVVDTIIAKHTRMHGASVTYTPESWRYLNDKLAERYPDESAVIVGWYHTHPGFGIFLSGMDLFIHQNFFTQKWHVAMVLDPRARRSGFFCWDRKMTRVDAYEFPWPKWATGSW